MYKVFLQDRRFEILYQPHPQALSYRGITALQAWLAELEAGERRQLKIYSPHPAQVWSDFCSLYQIIEAAGGLVLNDFEESLWIYRLGRWDLPKGKIERGETPEEAARREVAEECGLALADIVLEAPLTETYHTYHLAGVAVLKRTYWYRMQVKGCPALLGQAEEDIEAAQWTPATEVEQKLSDTYPNIAVVWEVFNSL